jgi:hypothetical protein
VWGEYQFQIDDVYRDTEHTLAPGSTVTLIRGGGAVCTSEGRWVVNVENQAPLLEGQRYLVFLTAAGLGRYETSARDFSLGAEVRDASIHERASGAPDELIADIRSVVGSCE